MRTVVLAAIVLVAAGCASADRHSHGAANSTPARANAAAPGDSLAQMVAWVRAGAPGDEARYRTAHLDDGSVTDLESDRAFTSPSGKISCTSDYEEGSEGLDCLVDLADPPPKPAKLQGNWTGGWINYTGDEANIGSLHGDPGPFIRGRGPELPYGSTVVVREYACRSESSGVTCVNPNAGSGVRISDAGVVAFGCLRERPVPSNRNVGKLFHC
ncbi:hypothetical protein [Nocardia australiensis]|uniref:hypothetical protein n=1 Tax=Nocardia australiensis TaxID=2887191 RepID=UPI001D154B65|nr:hypothetical protein [Nocardia australiensis]